MKTQSILFVALLVGAFMSTAAAQTTPIFTDLKGSKAKVAAAHDYATTNDLSFMKDEAQIEKFVHLGLLAELKGNDDYALNGMSFPYVRPAAKLLVERLSAQCRKATGEGLFVNSGVRTTDEHFWNSSALSVHPVGIAIDFKVPRSAQAKKWLEGTLLALQSRGTILATHEHRPPHYHVVVLPREYEAYVAGRLVAKR